MRALLLAAALAEAVSMNDLLSCAARVCFSPEKELGWNQSHVPVQGVVKLAASFCEECSYPLRAKAV